MADIGIANKGEAEKCLEIAKQALAAERLDKAAKFAEKAMRLYPNDEVRKVLRIIKSKQGGETSTSRSPENGFASAATPNGLHRRQNARGEAAPAEDKSTPEQREIVAAILRTTNYYEILSIARDAGEDDIKKAYRRLALRLHPDKNTAPGADEAFKAVSRAFSCLSDPQKRASYDAHGCEDPALARARGAGPRGPFGDDIDPEEIFNMFFNAGFGGQPMRGHVFQGHFGRGAPRAAPAQPASPALQILQLLPIILLILFTFLSSPGDPAFSLDHVRDYTDELATKRYGVPFFVKSVPEFERRYPRSSHDRARVEAEAEAAYKQRLEQQCYAERLNVHKLQRWGYAERARNFSTAACDELRERFGLRYATYAY